MTSPCPLCPTGSACLAGGLPLADRARWEQIQSPHPPLTHARKTLFAMGDAATAVFVVRAGCIKTCTVDTDGNERIQGFFFPGDIVGLDALGTDHYLSTAVALSPSQVCRISRAQIEAMIDESPALSRRLLERLSASLRSALLQGGDFTADERVAAFLLRMQQRAGAAQGLSLPMTRRDIGNFLRLATETVCRVLTRFEKQGWIEARLHEVALRDHHALARLAAPLGFERLPAAA